MKFKASFVFCMLCLLGTIPCYASTHSETRFDFIVFFLAVIIGGIILGFVTKLVLSVLSISVSNWLIFLTSIMLAGIFLILLGKSFY